MRISDFTLYKDLLQKESGLTLEPDQSYLLDSRLTPVAKKWGYMSLGSMTTSLRGIPEPELVQDIVEAMTFKDTAFCYDSPECEAFRQLILPYLSKKRKKKHGIYIWSTACGSGQEAYSVATSVLECREIIPNWQVKILATDISNRFIEEAQKAEYSQVEIQRGLPVKMAIKHGVQGNKRWKINDDVRELITFQQFNLMDDMDPLGFFDVIFCRNVLCYFEQDVRQDILHRLAGRLPDDGFLLLGESEKLPPGNEDFKPVEDWPGLYIPADGVHKEKELAKIAAQ